MAKKNPLARGAERSAVLARARGPVAVSKKESPTTRIIQAHYPIEVYDALHQVQGKTRHCNLQAPGARRSHQRPLRQVRRPRAIHRGRVSARMTRNEIKLTVPEILFCLALQGGMIWNGFTFYQYVTANLLLAIGIEVLMINRRLAQQTNKQAPDRGGIDGIPNRRFAARAST